MIALIPGITESLAMVKPPALMEKPRGDGFARLLAAAGESRRSASGPAAPPARYVVQPGDNLSRIAKKLGYADTRALTRANHLKDPDRLQVGQVLRLPDKPAAGEAEAVTAANPATRRRPPETLGTGPPRRLVVASWYGPPHHGRRMANGQPFDMQADTVAHPSLPLGTRLKLTNPRTGTTAQVKVTDRGPFVPGRDLDLSMGVARKLGILRAGVAKLYMEGG